MVDSADVLDEDRFGPGASLRREPVATVMRMRWDGVTEDQYEQAREKVGWDRDVPAGAKLHVAGFSDGGLNVLDVRESPEAFQAFSEQRLGPAVQEIGIEGEPDVRFYPMHACFAPALGRTETLNDL
jgi:hypothetical protein